MKKKGLYGLLEHEFLHEEFNRVGGRMMFHYVATVEDVPTPGLVGSYLPRQDSLDLGEGNQRACHLNEGRVLHVLL